MEKTGIILIFLGGGGGLDGILYTNLTAFSVTIFNFFLFLKDGKEYYKLILNIHPY